MATRQRGKPTVGPTVGPVVGPAVGTAAKRLLGERRLLIATNRGPITFTVDRSGELRPRRGSGGLVTALSHVGRHVPVTWLAAPMSEGDRRAAGDPALIAGATKDDRLRLRFAQMERPSYEAAYNVIANPLLWFLQHQMYELPYRPMLDAGALRAWDAGYVPVNRAFAEALLAEERVGVVPGTAFGPSGAGHVRVCYATAMEQIVEAMNRIERFVSRHGG
jgi:trehalose-6-phosphate synthase